jgi:ABC-2 type transport system permease protein
MLSVYRKEMKSYFCTFYGYVILAVYLFFSGLFTSVINLFGASSSIELSYGYTSFVLLLTVPFLSLHGLSDERRQKTDLLLYSLPIRSRDIVIGKYLAMISLVGIGECIGALAGIILTFYGETNAATAFSGTVAYFLCSCALLSVGLFLSALTESVLVSALLTFGAMLLIYFLPDLILLLPTTAIGSFLTLTVLILLLGLLAYGITKSVSVSLIFVFLFEMIQVGIFLFYPTWLEGRAAKLFSSLSVTERLANFTTYGLFDWQGILYFFCILILFLYFTTLAVEKRRWS